MGKETRRALVRALVDRYRGASRPEKQRILDEFVAVSGYHRKHAVRLFRRAPSGSVKTREPRRRIYDAAVRETLVIVWETADRICGKRLKVVLPSLVQAMERHGHLEVDAEVRRLLLAMSAATMDRLLTPVRAEAGGRRRRAGARTTWVKRQVRVRTFADWGDPIPGFFEADFVLHSGPSAAGSFVHTLVLTDIASGWTECVPLVAREQSLVVEGLDFLQTQLPVAVVGLDTDNDSAFMNETILSYCEARKIEFTRSRAYQKNDQAWVEQKNGAIVRRLAGYERFSGLEGSRILARLFQSARLYVNFFQPSFKLREKTRIGAKVKKVYFPLATPCDRLLADPRVGADVKQRLERERAPLDPVQLLHAIREAQAELAALVTSRGCDDAPVASASLQQFLAKLPILWREGEARPTHRSRVKPPRTWRTRKDPFENTWSEVLEQLEARPDATAKELFAQLEAKYPGMFAPGQLRTLQRRVQDWRRECARELVLASADSRQLASA